MKAYVLIDIGDDNPDRYIAEVYRLNDDGDVYEPVNDYDKEFKALPQKFNEPIDISTSKEMNFGYMMGHDILIDEITGETE